jgi:putative phosphoesterase
MISPVSDRTIFAPQSVNGERIMRLGVVSDSHNNVPHVQAAVAVLQQEQVDVVVHCGDVGGPEVVELFAAWPTHFVAGNCDSAVQLRTIVERSQLTYHPLRAELELAGRKIAVLHSHVLGSMAAAIESNQFDLICYGHTHRPEFHREGTALVLNPGALHRATEYSLAIVELDDLSVRHVAVPCD